MKMRFSIEYIYDLDTWIMMTILMKDIKYVVIKGKKIQKPNTNKSDTIQAFYFNIASKKTSVTEIMMLDGRHMFLKNAKLHSYDTYCLFNPSPMGDVFLYADKGRVMKDDELDIFMRTKKLNKIKRNIT